MSKHHSPVINPAMGIRWLTTACLLGCVLLTGCKDEDRSGGFFYAVRVGWVKEVTALVNADPDLVNATEKMDMTGLDIAIHSDQLPMVQVLIAAGSNVNRESAGGTMPLLEAARYGHSDIMKALLNAGARVNARSVKRSSFGNPTPLGEAAWHGHVDAVKLLLKYGADVNLGRRFDEQETPMHEALSGWDKPTADRIRLLTLLLDAGADVNAKDRYGNTPLRCARRNTHLHSSIVDLLVERGGTE